MPSGGSPRSITDRVVFQASSCLEELLILLLSLDEGILEGIGVCSVLVGKRQI